MFHDWDSFYILIGSGAGGLIGLLVVVATLTGGRERANAVRGASIYLTPTVFHFTVILTISGVALAPTATTTFAGCIMAVSAMLGFIYGAVSSVRILKGKAPETPHWSDFWCYGVVPSAIYLGLGVAAFGVWSARIWAANGAAVALMLLLLTGIRNAWDLVTWLAPRRDGP